jgi:hypothetical protein
MAKGKKTGGRQPGSLNRATAEAKPACAALVDDPAYRQALNDRLRTGQLAPAECMLWYYAKGKPTEHMAVTGTEGGPLEIVVRKPWA